MNKDFSELVEYLDEKFAEIDTKIEKLDNKVDSKFDRLLDSIDKLTKAIETYHQEQVALSAKVDRHEKWIQQIAEKIEIELKT